MKKVIKSKNLLITFFIVILLIPENSGSIVPSLPVDNVLEVFITALIIFIFIKLINNKKITLALVFGTLVIKVLLLLQPTNMWKLCYQDDLASRYGEEIGQSVDNQFNCEKLYHLNVNGYSTLTNEINFFSEPENEWLGANASNFKLGFFNNKKFNHKKQWRTR